MLPLQVDNNVRKDKRLSIVLVMVCIYMFFVIERPWESINFLHNVPIERPTAIVLIIVAILSQKFKIVSSPTNKWVYAILTLHFAVSPFAFSPPDALDQSIEYAKMVLLYLLMLSVADDEKSLKLIVKVFVFSIGFYMLHSLWEYHNGKHVWRMGISRMVGVDASAGDPNSFGASVVLSIPFVYALFRTELSQLRRGFYCLYFLLSVYCVVLTGSRTSFVVFLFMILLWILTQQGVRRIQLIFAAFLVVSALWVSMPEEKQERIRTLWDEKAGPANAHDSARGRLVGWKVSWKMFQQRPITGVGPGGKNFIGYRLAHQIDENTHGEGGDSPTQSHVLYGQVLAEQGLGGAILFSGLVISIAQTAFAVRRLGLSVGKNGFKFYLSGAILVSLLLLLLFGFGGHNFYRPLWLWLAAWSGSLLMMVRHNEHLVAKVSA